MCYGRQTDTQTTICLFMAVHILVSENPNLEFITANRNAKRKNMVNGCVCLWLWPVLFEHESVRQRGQHGE